MYQFIEVTTVQTNFKAIFFRQISEKIRLFCERAFNRYLL